VGVLGLAGASVVAQFEPAPLGFVAPTRRGRPHREQRPIVYNQFPTQDAPVKRIIPNDFKSAAKTLKELGWLGVIGSALVLVLAFVLYGGESDAFFVVLLVTTIVSTLVGLAFAVAFLVLSPKVAVGGATARIVALWLVGISIGFRVLSALTSEFALFPFLVNLAMIGLAIKVIVKLCSADVRSFLAGR
jgi:hypothetical protein